MITEADFTEVEFSTKPDGVDREVWLRERVATYLAWVDAGEFEGISPNFVLRVTAELLETLGDLEQALRVARRATSSGEDDTPLGMPVLVSILLALEDTDEAKRASDVLRAVLRADPDRIPSLLLERMGEEFAYVEQLAVAERWYTMAVRLIEERGESELDWARAAHLRASVRRRAGKPSDATDDEAEQLRIEYGWDDADPLTYRSDLA